MNMAGYEAHLAADRVINSGRVERIIQSSDGFALKSMSKDYKRRTPNV